MSPDALIDRVEQAPTVAAARSALRPFAFTEGVSQAYFRRVATLIGEDPEAARRLSDRWQIFSDLGDDPAQAYRIKGVAERLRGKWAASIPSFQEAGRRARNRTDAFAFRVAEIESLGRIGKTPDAIRLAKRIVYGLKRLGEPGLAARSRLNAAAALLWVDDYRGAQRWLCRARDELDAQGMVLEAAGARMSLSACLLHTTRPDEAAALSREAKAVFEQHGQSHMAALCDSNIAQSFLQTGRPDEALALFLELRDRFRNAPLDAARTEEFLGNAFFRSNMPEEAELAYQAALDSSAIKALPINRANCLLGLARTARASGNLAVARRSARMAQRAFATFGNEIWHAIATVAESDALLGLRQFASARQSVDRAMETLQRGNARFALAEVLLIRAAAEWGAGTDPRTTLHEAERLLRREGRWALEWRVHDLRAQAASGASTLRSYRKMADAIVRSRALIVSNTAKSSFLDDKADALSRYLGVLLSRGTPAQIEEALDVIRRTRSAALIDEALAAISTPMASHLREELEGLRREIGSVDTGGDAGAGTRRSRPSGSSRSVAKRWLELTWAVNRSDQVASPTVSPKTLVLAVTSKGVFGIRNGRTHCIGSAEAVERKLRWLRFELFSALADPDASPDVSMELAQDLRRDLLPLWADEEAPTVIAPDGFLWSVPWAALAHSRDSAREPLLVLGPGINDAASRWTLPESPRVVVWGAPHPHLPQIEKEIEQVRRTFPKAQVLDSASDIREFLAHGQADILHVAAHARLHPDKPMFSFLEFSDGIIHAAELARSDFRVDHVALSACDTGSLSLMNRHEPQGLVRAFLARGAKVCLASLWALDDKSAATLMEKYYQHLCVGKNTACALHLARIHLRKGRPHPYFWASMALFGGYRT